MAHVKPFACPDPGCGHDLVQRGDRLHCTNPSCPSLEKTAARAPAPKLSERIAVGMAAEREHKDILDANADEIKAAGIMHIRDRSVPVIKLGDARSAGAKAAGVSVHVYRKGKDVMLAAAEDPKLEFLVEIMDRLTATMAHDKLLRMRPPKPVVEPPAEKPAPAPEAGTVSAKVLIGLAVEAEHAEKVSKLKSAVARRRYGDSSVKVTKVGKIFPAAQRASGLNTTQYYRAKRILLTARANPEMADLVAMMDRDEDPTMAYHELALRLGGAPEVEAPRHRALYGMHRKNESKDMERALISLETACDILEKLHEENLDGTKTYEWARSLRRIAKRISTTSRRVYATAEAAASAKQLDVQDGGAHGPERGSGGAAQAHGGMGEGSRSHVRR